MCFAGFVEIDTLGSTGVLGVLGSGDLVCLESISRIIGLLYRRNCSCLTAAIQLIGLNILVERGPVTLFLGQFRTFSLSQCSSPILASFKHFLFKVQFFLLQLFGSFNFLEILLHACIVDVSRGSRPLGFVGIGLESQI